MARKKFKLQKVINFIQQNYDYIIHAPLASGPDCLSLEQIQAYCYNKPGLKNRAYLESHIRSCKKCSEWVRIFKKFDPIINSDTMPEEYWTVVVEEMKRYKPEIRSRVRKLMNKYMQTCKSARQYLEDAALVFAHTPKPHKETPLYVIAFRVFTTEMELKKINLRKAIRQQQKALERLDNIHEELREVLRV